MQLLLDNGAVMNRATTNYGAFPLIIACEDGFPPLAQLLVAQGAVVDQVDNQGATSLGLACLDGHVSVVRWLLDSHASINIQCLQGAS